MEAESTFSEEGFASAYNMGLGKIYRVHNSLNYAKMCRYKDLHVEWKSCLDSIFCEIRSYLKEQTNADILARLLQAKVSSKEALLEYLKWEQTGVQQNMKNHILQSKQAEVEEFLDTYEDYLIEGLQALKMDMPKNDNISSAALGSKY